MEDVLEFATGVLDARVVIRETWFHLLWLAVIAWLSVQMAMFAMRAPDAKPATGAVDVEIGAL